MGHDAAPHAYNGLCDTGRITAVVVLDRRIDEQYINDDVNSVAEELAAFDAPNARRPPIFRHFALHEGVHKSTEYRS